MRPQLRLVGSEQAVEVLEAICDLRLDMHHPTDDVDDDDNEEQRPSRSKCTPVHLRRVACSTLAWGGPILRWSYHRGMRRLVRGRRPLVRYDLIRS